MKRVGMILALLALSFTWALAGDWPQFEGPTRNDVSPETGLLHAFPEGGPKVLWTAPLGEGFGGAAVFGGKVYLMDRQAATEMLRCLDVKTGAEDWNFSFEAPGKLDYNGSRSVPTVTDKYVFIVGQFGHAFCLDRNTHAVLWKTNLISDFGSKKWPRWGVSQSPLLYKDMVILAPQSPTVGLVAFDQVTGAVKWKSEPVGGMAYVSPFLNTLDGVDQVIMQSENTTAGADAATGKILWTYKGWTPDIPITAPTPMGDGRFFLTEGYKAGSAMIKVAKQGDAWTATELYKTQACGAQIHSPLLIDGYLYLNSNSNDRHQGLLCLNPADGKAMWQTDKKPNFERGNLLYADGVIYIMEGTTGILRIVQPSPEGYKQLSEAKVLEGDTIWGPMAISNGLLFCRDLKQMKCLDIRKP